MDSQKIANNILEFLIDPTKFPVKTRLYFRPEENLDNRSFDAIKQEVHQAYKDQKCNSDFYPLRNLSEKQAFGTKSLENILSLARDGIVTVLQTPGIENAKDEKGKTVVKLLFDSMAQKTDEQKKKIRRTLKTFIDSKPGIATGLSRKQIKDLEPKPEAKPDQEVLDVVKPLKPKRTPKFVPPAKKPGMVERIKQFFRTSSTYNDFHLENLSKETIMDRKTLIASLDVLSQHFIDESDPIATDLRTIAFAVSKMADEELDSRVASDITAKQKAEFLTCEKCGNKKVLKMKDGNGYCLPCKKKVKGPKEEEPKASKKADFDDDSFWTKAAAEAVRETLIAEVCPSKKEDDEEAEVTAKKKKEPKQQPAEAPAAEPAPAEATPAPAPVVEPAPAPAVTPEEPEQPAEKPAKEAVVDTGVLTASVEGFEMELGPISEDDIGILTAAEKAQLDSLFNK